MRTMLSAVAAASLAGSPGVTLAATPAASAPARLTLCRPGPAEPSRFPDLRPSPTATCPYDAQSLATRIEHMIERALKTTPEAIGTASNFGLPALTTRYDSPRIADYAMTASGADWKIHLVLDEAAYPLDDALPAVFEPGMKPRRLVDPATLDVRMSVAIFPKPGASGPDGCLTAARLGAFAVAAGWQDQTAMSPIFVTDAGPGYPRYAGPDKRLMTFQIDHQEGHVPNRADMETRCVTSVNFNIPAKAKVAG